MKGARGAVVVWHGDVNWPGALRKADLQNLEPMI